MKERELATRYFRLVVALHAHRRGASSRHLAEELGVSRPTIDRDLKALREQVGVPIDRETVNGETRHVLRDLPITTISATPLQAGALRIARNALEPLAGTELVDQLDTILSLMPTAPAEAPQLDIPRPRSRTRAAIVRTLETGMRERKRVRIDVRVASRGGALESYVVEPTTLRVADDDLYMLCWAVERDAYRTFKVSRIQRAIALDEPASVRPPPAEDGFRSSVKAWSGQPTDVVIRLAPRVAHFVEEYPLVADQRVARLEDGSVRLEATVAGIIEVSRWVLSWGASAEVLSPEPLRQLLFEEHRRAAEAYAQRARSPIVSDVAGSATTEHRSRGASNSRRRKRPSEGQP